MFDPNQSGDSSYQRPSQGRGGFSGRLILAIIIALIGWFVYAHHTEVNPVTGEKQHVSLTPKQEVRLGLESAPQMAEQMGGELEASDPRAQEVQKIGAILVQGTEAKDSPWQFKFHLLADPETVNAFALPGGQIFITWGLLKRLETEAQLAGVLGHEMGHVIERHSAQQMAKSQLGQWVVIAVATGASDQSGGNNAPMMVASMVNQMIQLRYSRKDESQADIWGLKLMEKVGYDPRAMIQVMEVLKAATGRGGAPLAIFQTHPDPDLRIKQIKAYLQEHPPAPNLSEGKNLKGMY